MKGTDLSRQLGDLPEDMIAEAMAPAKILRRKNLTGRLLRIAAAAAAVVIMCLAAALLPVGGDQGSPYFAINVYADEANKVELNQGENKTVFAEDIFGSGADAVIYPESNITEDGVPRYTLEIQFYQEPERIEIFCNEELVYEQRGRVTFCDPVIVSHSVFKLRWTEEHVCELARFHITGSVDEDSVFEFILYDEEGDVLQKNTIQVQPVEGGYVITLTDIYIK